ncbi:hypothetical protein ASD06_08495 [Angustibacter sp. Root456]|nr:hypothetical protein ASD06_08495 [Angustibacter sp. Root456]
MVPPVVVVLDLSGSMNDDDGTGLIKLTGAKKAVDEVIRGLPSSQPFGLWTYPGGADDCGSGSFAITPGTIRDLAGTIARADALTADGGTPTGPALQSAADALTSQGTSKATLVLISDGESNCGDSPCTVAKDLVTKGFDVTIHTVGFRVSAQGRSELNCVASATGGTYVDVDNSKELNQTLKRLTRARLRIQAAGQAGQLDLALGRLTVTVSNDSAVTANDVQLLLTLDRNAPAIGNTLLRIGNLLPGTSVVRTWSVGSPVRSPGAAIGQNDATTTKFALRAWARNADEVSANGVVGRRGADSGQVTMKDDLGDVFRRPLDAGHPIVILGDSYSAGEGTFDYVAAPRGVSAACHRSNKSYLIAELDPGDVVNLACSGAVSWDLYYEDGRSTPPQLTQLDDLDRAPGAVVMTLGGNDIGFADIVRECVVNSCDADAAQIESWNDSADSLRTWLGPVYEDVWKTINIERRRKQRNGAYAPVVVLAYPQVTHATKFGACGRIAGVKHTIGAGEVRVANNLVAHLNAALRAAVADARSAGYEVYFVQETADAMLPNHTLCDGRNAYVNDVLPIPAAKWPPIDARPESVHPNISGYAAETGAIVGWSAVVTPVPPDTSSHGPTATKVTDTPWSLLPFGTPSVDVSAQHTVDGSLLDGGPVIIQGTGYEPGGPVIVSIHSTPAVLGTLIADEDGDIRGTLHLPPRLELGRHEIVASGKGADGTFRQDRVAVSVLARAPAWVQLALVGTCLLLVVAVVCTALWRRGSRGGRSTAEDSPRAQPSRQP